MKFSDFSGIYDELTNDVMRARHQFFLDQLRMWFEAIDAASGISETVDQLQKSVDFKQWYDAAQSTQTGMVGSGKLEWPGDYNRRIAMQLSLFRAMADDKIDPLQFCLSFLYSGKRLDDNISGLTDQIFRPMANGLRRYLERVLPAQDVRESAPASDRVVTLDHNSREFIEAVSALNRLVSELTRQNDYEDQEDREQKLAEIRAGMTLLQSTRVRVAAIGAVLRQPLIDLSKKFVDIGLGKAAAFAWTKLVALISWLS